MNLFLLLLALLSAQQEPWKRPRVPFVLANGMKVSIEELKYNEMSNPTLSYDWVDSDTLLFEAHRWLGKSPRRETLFVNLKTHKTNSLMEYTYHYTQLQLMPSGVYANYPSLSPDKKKTASLESSYPSPTVYVLDLEGKTLQRWQIPTKYGTQRSRLFWFSDSQRCALITGGKKSHLLLYHLKHTAPIRAIPLHKDLNTFAPISNYEILGFTAENNLLCCGGVPQKDSSFMWYVSLFSVDLVNFKTRTVRQSLPDRRHLSCYPILSPDGQKLLRIVYDIYRKEPLVVLSDIEGKSWRTLGFLLSTEGFTYEHYSLRWKPDGKHFSIMYKNDLWIIPLSKTDQDALLKTKSQWNPDWLHFSLNQKRNIWLTVLKEIKK